MLNVMTYFLSIVSVQFVQYSIQSVDDCLSIGHPHIHQNKTDIKTILDDVPTNIKEIRIINSNLPTIPSDSFTGHVQLDILCLSGNQIKVMEQDVFKGLKFLRILDLSKNNIGNLQNTLFSFFQQLEILSLSENSITNLPDKVFEQLSHLKELHLNRNSITEINKYTWVGLHNLKYLDLKQNKIKEVSGKWDRNLGTFIDNWSNLKNLETLNLKRNKIKGIGQNGWADLGQLKYLNLEDNIIANIKERHRFLWDLSNLKYLNLKHNKIEIIFRNMWLGLANLEILNLQQNYISELESNAFNGLDSLRCLYLQGNKINEAKLSPHTGWTVLQSLKHLDLKQNNLGKIPNNLFNNLHLDALHLQNNNIIEVTGWGSLTSVTNLYLQDNMIQEINHNPCSHHSCSNGLYSLCRLYLDNNNLNILTVDTFKHMPNLQVLSLTGNNITFIERGVFRDTSLLILNISNNRIHFANFDTTHCNDNTLATDLKEAIRSITSLGTKVEWCFVELHLQHNNLFVLPSTMFNNLSFLVSLYLGWNNIHKIAKDSFSHTKFKTVHLNHNKLTIIQSKTFHNQNYLQILILRYNSIQKIENGAFLGPESISQISLNNNKLKVISQNIFEGVTTKQPSFLLTLDDNQINEVSPGSFSFLENLKKVQVDISLSNNSLSVLSWMIFHDTSQMYSCIESTLTRHKIRLSLNGNNMSCSNEQCWMQDMNLDHNKDIFRACKSDTKIEGGCSEKSALVCPTIDRCMVHNDDECSAKCRNDGHADGKLSIEPYVCPLMYLCTCITCPAFNRTLCELNCTETGRIVSRRKSHYSIGCEICDCQCKDVSCMKTCKSHPFEILNNTYSCPECNCLCTDIDCDTACGGKGLGVKNNDTLGCLVCDGCKTIEAGGVGNSFILIIALSVISSVALGLLLVLCLCCIFRPNEKEEENVIDKNRSRSNILETFAKSLQPNQAQEVRQCWIDSDKIIPDQFLGKGQYGLVWTGRLQTGPYSNLQIVLKKCRAEWKDGTAENTSCAKSREIDEGTEDFLQEAMLIRQFNHPNVLSILGVSIHEDKLCVILPLMSNGDLQKYLLKHNESLTAADLLSFALGVAKGMHHLTELNFVHCDLAARNCLLDNNLVIKVSDFGLAKKTENQESLEIDKERKAMPIRWMSIEAIQHGQLTVKSDVWSYGVLLWELFSFGNIPYRGLEKKNLLSYLERGNRLRKPLMCPVFIYEIMSGCWSQDPEERPDFLEILSILNKAADKEAGYLEMPEEIAQEGPEKSF